MSNVITWCPNWTLINKDIILKTTPQNRKQKEKTHETINFDGNVCYKIVHVSTCISDRIPTTSWILEVQSFTGLYS